MGGLSEPTRDDVVERRTDGRGTSGDSPEEYPNFESTARIRLLFSCSVLVVCGNVRAAKNSARTALERERERKRTRKLVVLEVGRSRLQRRAPRVVISEPQY